MTVLDILILHIGNDCFIYSNVYVAMPFSDDTIEYESIHCWLGGLPPVPVKKTKVEVEAIEAPMDPVKKRKVKVEAVTTPVDPKSKESSDVPKKRKGQALGGWGRIVQDGSGVRFLLKKKKIKGKKKMGTPMGGTTKVVGGSIPPVPAREKQRSEDKTRREEKRRVEEKKDKMRRERRGEKRREKKSREKRKKRKEEQR